MAAHDPIDPRVRLAIARWPDDAPRGAVSTFCAEHGISRKSFYELRKPARADRPASVLEPRSRRLRSSPSKVSDQVKDQALRVRAELEASGLDHGPISVHAIFRRSSARHPRAAAETCGRVRETCRSGPATLVLFAETTLYFETDQGDGFREPGFSKERRLERQITIGLLTDVRGFPLQVRAFTGNTAETHTIVPVMRASVAVVAGAGTISEFQPERPRGHRLPGTRPF